MSHLGRRLLPKARVLLPAAAVSVLALASSGRSQASFDSGAKFEQFLKNQWAGQAIVHQVELSFDVPLAKASMMGSHNSYNSSGYPSGAYIDPNQKFTMLDQLKAGSHFIEMDLHDNKGDILLCHSKHEKGGMGACSPGNGYVHDGLKELKRFLEDPKYKDRVFILYLENYSTDTEKLYGRINSTIGTHIYRSGPGDCPKPIPAETLTAKKMLAAGKRVLIWNSAEVGKACSDFKPFRDMVFTDIGVNGRTWEDQTIAAAAGDTVGSGGHFKKWTKSDVTNNLEKGKNLANHDFLQIDDAYKGMVWSWDVDRPDDKGSQGEADCAWQTSKAGSGKGHTWDDGSCTNEGHFACENAKGEWKVTQAKKAWSEGDATCKKEFKSEFFFSFPATAEENLALTKAKRSGSNPWLNLTDKAKEGTWVGKHRWSSPPTCGKGKSCIGKSGDAGSVLQVDDKLKSPNGKAVAVMQEDCNFVVYKSAKPIWMSGTAGKGTGCQLAFQGDGNLVIYKKGGVAVWHSNSAGKGSILHLQNNGALVMYGRDEKIAWSAWGR